EMAVKVFEKHIESENKKICRQPHEDLFVVTDIIGMLKNPSVYYVKRLNNFGFGLNSESLEDKESYFPDKLSSYIIRRKIFNMISEQYERQHIFKILRYSGQLPPYAFGRSFFDQEYNRMSDLYKKTGKNREKLYKELEINGRKVILDVELMDGRNQLVFLSKPNGEKELECLLSHMLVNMAGPVYTEVFFCDEDKNGLHIITKRLQPPDNRYAEKIIKLYEQGLRAPLPIFPETLFKYIGKYKKGIIGKKHGEIELLQPDFQNEIDSNKGEYIRFLHGNRRLSEFDDLKQLYTFFAQMHQGVADG
ncbi:MAG: hypothetical protein ACOCWO_05820, partial [Candidatus Muiribacteriaceae bacterium]